VIAEALANPCAVVESKDALVTSGERSAAVPTQAGVRIHCLFVVPQECLLTLDMNRHIRGIAAESAGGGTKHGGIEMRWRFESRNGEDTCT
jgi:hypothetical protein